MNYQNLFRNLQSQLSSQPGGNVAEDDPVFPGGIIDRQGEGEQGGVTGETQVGFIVEKSSGLGIENTHIDHILGNTSGSDFQAQLYLERNFLTRMTLGGGWNNLQAFNSLPAHCEDGGAPGIESDLESGAIAEVALGPDIVNMG